MISHQWLVGEKKSRVKINIIFRSHVHNVSRKNSNITVFVSQQMNSMNFFANSLVVAQNVQHAAHLLQ